MRVLKAFLLISIMITGVFAAVSVETLTFQGRLTGSDGQPVEGTREMSYVLFDAQDDGSADGGGNPLFEWTCQEGAADYQSTAPSQEDLGSSIPIYRGIYAVSLPFEDSVLQAALKNYDDLYIEVHVKYPDPVSWERLSPRVKVASSMFSMMANQVKWAKADDPTSGNLGIRYNDDSSIGIGREPRADTKVSIHNRDLADALRVSGDVIISAGSTPAANPGNLSVAGDLNVVGDITGARVYNAVWNDLAEFRLLKTGEPKVPGRAYLSTPEGLVLPHKRCQRGVVGIYSDSYGFSLGGKKTETNKIPLAISGWVLAHVDSDYPIGTALVNDEGGFLTKASFWEKIKYPERILAVVDTGPDQYNGVPAEGRVWVKVK